ncbi:hypothetical protein TUM20984_52980 [Mycobacterium antarcticum]|nr:hypothetical protein TUM20984_52980 [Mycolicibacterium sp. TUM20984]
MPITAIEETGVSATYFTLSNERTRSPDPVALRDMSKTLTYGARTQPRREAGGQFSLTVQNQKTNFWYGPLV